MNTKVALVAVAVATVALTLPLVSHGGRGTPQALSSNGSSPASMTAQWWQWAYSIPDTPASEGAGSIHPLVGDNDDFGAPDLYEFCGNGQHGRVWFLGGDFSGTGEDFERTCKIPAGKTIILAVINWECSTAEGDATKGDPAWKQARQLKDCAEQTGDILSGTAWFGPEAGPLEEVKVRRLRTVQAFPVYFPPANIIGLANPDPNPSLVQADGQWLILRNLNPGRYRLEFTGSAGDPPFFVLNGAYNIEIAQPNGEPPNS